MSLCYDFQKWTIISMLAILSVCLVGMVNLVFGITPALPSFNANATQAVQDEANRKFQEESRKFQEEMFKNPPPPEYFDDPTTPWNETADPERTERETYAKLLQEEMRKSMKGYLEFILNNCYQHSDRPNPVQDLID